MTDDELVWRVAGGSGDGANSTSRNFAKALMRMGRHVFTHRHYPSRIRGGHTHVEIRSTPSPVRSRGDGYSFPLAPGEEERLTGRRSDAPIVEQYFGEDATWKQAADLLGRHR